MALQKMAELTPATPLEMQSVEGFPAQIYQKYNGEKFLAVTSKYRQQRDSLVITEFEEEPESSSTGRQARGTKRKGKRNFNAKSKRFKAANKSTKTNTGGSFNQFSYNKSKSGGGNRAGQNKAKKAGTGRKLGMMPDPTPGQWKSTDNFY
ncbi:uncharacterized protein LOC106157087 [Lingula anatina]|nr:uncharacterized protein LOC106157087 [Lingula anatina]|eukprot:XP_013388043.1 uncharacterized protein LOC106157087 [Lingula anatina]